MPPSKLTPFVITSHWLAMHAATHGGGGFSIALWCDSDDAQKRARVVIGKEGYSKSSFGLPGSYRPQYNGVSW